MEIMLLLPLVAKFSCPLDMVEVPSVNPLAALMPATLLPRLSLAWKISAVPLVGCLQYTGYGASSGSLNVKVCLLNSRRVDDD